MPIRLMRRAYRERRRVALVIVLYFVALKLIASGGTPLPLPAVWSALGLGLGLGALSLAMARLRGYAEASALASLGFALLMRAFPGTAIDIAGPAANLPVALAFWLGCVALARTLRRVLGALPQPHLRNPRFKTRAGTRLDIYRLWYGLVPTPGQANRFGDPDLVAVEDMSLRLGRVRLVTQATAEGPREAHLQILDVEAPFRIRIRASAEDARGVMRATGVSEIFLVDLGRRRLVLFSHEFPDMAVSRAFFAWLDDRPGRMLDRRLATIERRARNEDRQPQAPSGRAGPGRGPDAPDADKRDTGQRTRPGSSVEDWDDDAARDTARDTPRNTARDTARDTPRNTARDTARDAERDAARGRSRRGGLRAS